MRFRQPPNADDDKRQNAGNTEPVGKRSSAPFELIFEGKKDHGGWWMLATQKFSQQTPVSTNDRRKDYMKKSQNERAVCDKVK